MDALEIIDRIEEVIDKAKRIPFTSNVAINENEIYEMLDELRSVIPEEFRQAKWIVKERENMIEEARRQSEKIIKEAEEKAQILTSETEILKNANKKAEDIIARTEARARAIRLEAEDYADEKLASLVAILHKLISSIEKGREHFKAPSSSEDE